MSVGTAITGIRPSVIQFSSDSCTLFQKLMNIWGVQNTEKYGSHVMVSIFLDEQIGAQEKILFME